MTKKVSNINCIWCSEHNLCIAAQSSVLGLKCVLTKKVPEGRIMTCKMQVAKSIKK